jgi:RecG-like helicase
MEPRYNPKNSSKSNQSHVHQSNLNSQIPMEMNERPIKGATTGKYNLDFIDWDNEYESILTGPDQTNGNNEDQTFPGYNIPYGVSEATFAALIDQMQASNEEDTREGLPEEMRNLVKKMKMKKSGKECCVCFSNFQDGELIRKLPCTHIFHDKCVMPWLERSITCPNCRFNLSKFFTENPKGDYQ